MSFAARIDTLDIYSESMQKHIRCLVVTPQVPDTVATLHTFPVLYLLHGWSGDYAGWLAFAPQLLQHCDEYQMMMVFPDGGYDSWYLDSSVDSSVRYETHIVREVVPYIDQHYPTQTSQRGRAITGLSMGGHGAFYLAMRHPDVFGAIGSTSGGLDLRPFKRNDWDLKGVLGSHSTHSDNWERASVVNIADENLKNYAIIFDCGVDDFFLDVNRAMHQKLLTLDIDHEYTERPGAHDTDYWRNAIDFHVLFFAKYFGRIP